MLALLGGPMAGSALAVVAAAWELNTGIRVTILRQPELSLGRDGW